MDADAGLTSVHCRDAITGNPLGLGLPARASIGPISLVLSIRVRIRETSHSGRAVDAAVGGAQ